MSKLLSGSYANGYNLLGVSEGILDPVSVTGTIAIGSGLLPAALYAQGPNSWTITNQGSIAGGAVAAILLAAGGTVVNNQGGLLSGHYGVAVRTAQGSVSNGGIITAVNAGTSTSVYHAIGILLSGGGGVLNQSNGQITGRGAGVDILGGTGSVVNGGTINGSAYDGVYLSNGGVTNMSGAIIKGGTMGGGGSIGVGGAVVISGWGVVIRGGGSLFNAGMVTDNGEGGAFLGGGSVTNQGTISGGWGIDISGAAGTVTNSGYLDGTQQSGVFLTGGAVTNAAGGRIVGVSGVVVRGNAGTVANSGLIAATAPAGYAVYFASGFANRLVDNPGARFTGQVNGANMVGHAAVSTLELGTGSQSGTLSGLGTQFIDFAQVTVDPGAFWSLTGLNSIVTGAVLTNLGDLAVTGTLLVDGTLTSAGAMTVAAGAGIVASAMVDRSGALWNLSGELIAGDFGTANVTISNAASLAATAAVALGASAGGAGTLLVTGTGTRIDLSARLDVGQAGSGNLLIQNAAAASTGGDSGAGSNQGFDIATLPGGSGSATVTGTNSTLLNQGRFVVGEAGAGSLSILAGGTVTTAPDPGAGVPGDAVIANAAGASGSFVDVSGAGSNWRIAGLLDVGAAGSGALQLSGGATVTAGSLDSGEIDGAVGQISVSGAGTGLNIDGPAIIADDGTGVLSVLSGATFAATNLTIGSQADSSGAVVVSDAGSQINVTGALNIGTALGTGDLTVGPGAAIHAGVINQFGQVVDEGGLLDPTVLLDEGTDGGIGTIASDFVIDEGTIAANSKKANGVELVSGTVVGGGTLTISGGTTLDGTTENSPGLLLLDNIGTLEISGPVLNAADTTFGDNGTPDGAVTVFGTYEVVNSVVDVTFLKANEVLVLDDISGFNGTVTSVFGGDKIVISGGTLTNLGVGNGTTLTMDDSGNGGTDRIMFAAPVSSGKFSIVNGNTLQAVACFAAGTRIATADGPVAVQDLRAGDWLITTDGGSEPVIWLGQRRVDCTRHPKPETVWPVRISAHAFGENVPLRELYLSPDHAIFVNHVLVPAKLLIDGTRIAQVKRQAIDYFHVELPRHAVILAEGLPVESYLDTGDRANFAGAAAMAWETRGAAPLVTTGDALWAARKALKQTAPRAG